MCAYVGWLDAGQRGAGSLSTCSTGRGNSALWLVGCFLGLAGFRAWGLCALIFRRDYLDPGWTWKWDERERIFLATARYAPSQSLMWAHPAACSHTYCGGAPRDPRRGVRGSRGCRQPAGVFAWHRRARLALVSAIDAEVGMVTCLGKEKKKKVL